MGQTVRRAHTRKDGTSVRFTAVRTPSSLSLPDAVANTAKVAASDAAREAIESATEQPEPQPADVPPEEIQAAVDEVIGLPAHTDISLSPSGWNEARRAGHQRTGCQCGVNESDFATSMTSDQIEALHTCVAGKIDDPSMLMICLREGRADIEALVGLQERLRQDNGAGEDSDLDRLVAYMSAQESSVWRDGRDEKHLMYGLRLTARRVKYATRAVESAL